MWAKIFKKSLFEKITFPEGRICEDLAVLYKLYYKANSISEIDEALYGYYRANESSSTFILSEKYYKDEFFIRLLGDGVCPETRWVENANFVDIGFKIDERTGRVIMMGALDNMVKGAAGQAVQNMNILFGLKEATGLEFAPSFP